MTFDVCIYGLVTTDTALHYVRNIVIRGAIQRSFSSAMREEEKKREQPIKSGLYTGRTRGQSCTGALNVAFVEARVDCSEQVQGGQR